MADSKLICPTDGVKMNETKVRVVAGLVLLTALFYLFIHWFLLPLLLTVDFGLRSLNLGPYSPFGNLADWLVNSLKLPYKATDQAPKRFAARIGLAFSILITGLHLAALPVWIPAAVLAVFATLESLVGFCAGCYVYAFYVCLFPRAA